MSEHVLTDFKITWNLFRIISGGQCGADMAGLDVAKYFHISTGGTAPENFMTMNGPNPKLAEYGLIAHGNYKTRTIDNIRNSNITLIFAFDFESPGTKLTIKECKKYNKEFLLIDLGDEDIQKHVTKILAILNLICPSVINIAGNRSKIGFSGRDEVYDKTYIIFSNVIRKLINTNNIITKEI